VSRPDSTHHHGPLAGLGAGAAAVIAGCVLVLTAARRQLGEVATVVAWALMAAVVGAVIAAAVYVFLWLRHRFRYPETLAGRQVIRAEVLDEAPVPQAIQASAAPAAALEPPQVHLHFHGADPAEAAAIIRTAIPGPAGDAITEGKP
jgi:hypothetical protein